MTDTPTTTILWTFYAMDDDECDHCDHAPRPGDSMFHMSDGFDACKRCASK